MIMKLKASGKRLAFITAAVLLAVCVLSGANIPAYAASSTPYARHGALHVKGVNLTDRNGKVVQLKGVSTHGIAWYPQYVNQAAFKTLRGGWGANCIRLAMYTQEYGGWTSGGDKAQLEAVLDRGVKAASSLGMYVIIDWHILSDGNPNTHRKAAKAFFTKMAKKYGSNGHVLYEICNEPNGCSWAQVKKYADYVIPAIRKYSPKSVILVGTPTWCQDLSATAASPLKQKNIMYTCHFYAASHGQFLRDKVSAARGSGLPVFISEFSICDASGNGAINYTEANKWKSLIKKYQLSYCAWSLSNKAETASLLKSSTKKTSGWKTGDLSATGKWVQKMMKG
ncbi:MAG: glycoside hydrolase family 5 protein [Eubacterium sp.]